MNIRVDENAVKWYVKELELQSGDTVRFFPRYSSGGGLHPGFSLGLSIEKPNHALLQTEVEGITFYIEERDGWYLDGHNLLVNYLPAHDDIEYVYERINEE